MYAFLVDWYNGEYPHQRLGQAFYNKYGGPEPCPELFYEEDNAKAKKYIIENCVEFGGQAVSINLCGLTIQ